MRILFISPLPPPVHGQSLAGEMAINGLSVDNKLTVIDSALDKNFSGNKLPKIYSPQRMLKIVRVMFNDFRKVWLKRYDVVYMSVGITFRGFFRYVPYMVASILKREPYVIHTHGATFGDMYDNLGLFKKYIIKFFIVKSTRVIVLGNSLKSMFDDIMPLDKVCVCENGVRDDIFITDDEFNKKLNNFNSNRINLLFLSNLMKAKGILELFKAFELLPDNYVLNIAGSIEPDDEVVCEFDKFKQRFSDRVVYHGVVRGEYKCRLLCESDIFVLPSKNEGQPISILEAYRCGCGVVTNQLIGGTSDIFCDKINGETIDNKSPQDISRGIEECVIGLRGYALNNFSTSLRYSSKEFCGRLFNVLEDVTTKHQKGL